MICQIERPHPNILAAVSYNEEKMTGAPGCRPSDGIPGTEEIEDGYILATRNVPDGSSLVDEFERLRMLALKTVGSALKNTTFHMSVNPSEADAELDDEKAVEFISEVMSDLGFKDQPYRIYKHTDIARIHYHVVSTRCGQNGRKVKDSFDRLTLRNSLKRLAPIYGFSVVEKGDMSKAEKVGQGKSDAAETETDHVDRNNDSATTAESRTPSKSKVVPAFSRTDQTHVTWQLRNTFEDALRWSFSSFEQLQALMLRRYNVLVEIERGMEDRIVISGTDSEGKQITPILRETDLGIPMLERIRERMATSNMGARKEQKKKIEELSMAAANASSTFKEYVENMERKGAYVFVSFTNDGKPFGLTYLDRRTKCAWKGSETTTDLKWLLDVAEKKGWVLEMDRRLAAATRRNAMPSRKKKVSITKKSGEHPTAAAGKGMSFFIPPVPVVSHHTASDGPAVRKGEDSYEESIEASEQEERDRKRHPRSI